MTANRFELVNIFYIAFDEDRDEVTPVITRAMALEETQIWNVLDVLQSHKGAASRTSTRRRWPNRS